MREEWIEKGYFLFSQNGLTGLKVEPLAKAVNKSKSSFYHYFADLGIFTDELLLHHIRRSRLIAQKEKNARKINPDLINILLEHKTDIFFNQQLRFNQHLKPFQKVLMQSNQLVGDAFIKVWLEDLGLELSKSQIEGLFNLALDNFFLQINESNFSFEWLSNYFGNLRISIQQLFNR